MEKVSQTLRRAREQRKISREEASQHTHIPLSYLMVLEGENLDSQHHTRLLPDPLYLIPHLQRYATFLDIDANSAVAQFANELQDIQARQEKADALNQPHPRLGPSPQRSRATALSIVLASILVTLALIGQYSDLNIGSHGSGESPTPLPLPSTLTETPQPASTSSEPSEGNSPSAQPLPSTYTSLPSTPADSPKSSAPLDNSEASSALATQSNQANSSALEFSQTSVGTPSPTATALVEPPSNNPAHRLLVQAKETTWIRVLIEGQPPRSAGWA